MLVSRWRRAGLVLLYALGFTIVCLGLNELLVLRGCGVTGSCGPGQDASTVFVLVVVVAGTIAIGILGWNGRLPGTRAHAYVPPDVLKRSSVAGVVLLSFVSGGFYIPIWFQRRRQALNSLNSPAKLWEWGPPTLLVLQTLGMALAEQTRDVRAARIAAGVALLMLSFRVRSILADEGGAPPSPMLTLLFHIWYLQYRINSLVDERQVLRDGV